MREGVYRSLVKFSDEVLSASLPEEELTAEAVMGLVENVGGGYKGARMALEEFVGRRLGLEGEAIRAVSSSNQQVKP